MPEQPGCLTFPLELQGLPKKEQEKLKKAIEEIQADDRDLRLSRHPATEELTLTCMSMLHLELVQERLAEEYQLLHLPLGKPHVEYHATLKAPVEGTGQHEQQGKGRFRKGMLHQGAGKVDAWAKVQVTPAERGAGVDVEDASDGTVQSLRDALFNGIRKGLATAGPGGMPVDDV